MNEYIGSKSHRQAVHILNAIIRGETVLYCKLEGSFIIKSEKVKSKKDSTTKQIWYDEQLGA